MDESGVPVRWACLGCGERHETERRSAVEEGLRCAACGECRYLHVKGSPGFTEERAWPPGIRPF